MNACAVDRLAQLAITALLVLLLLLAALIGVPQAAAKSPAAERRIALVIGNARYATVPLDNPSNDARLIAGNLKRLGFDVAEHHDLGAREFRRVLRDFARRVQDAPGASVLYYAGHGVQIDGRNYLLPVDVNPREEDEVKDESVDLDDLFVSRVDRARGSASIVILDACRDNPFADKAAGRSGGKTRSLKTAGGLAEMSSRGTLVAFASAPGAVAEDGPSGAHSIYTKHLAAEMMREGVEVEQMFKNVRVNVLRDTKERQVPWVNTSLTTNFAFNPGGGVDKNDVAQDKAQRLEIEIATLKLQLADARMTSSSGGTGTSAASNATTLSTATPTAATNATSASAAKPADAGTAAPAGAGAGAPAGAGAGAGADTGTSATTSQATRTQPELERDIERQLRELEAARGVRSTATEPAVKAATAALPPATRAPAVTTLRKKCSSLLQRLSLGEPMSESDLKDLATTCR